MQNYYHKLTLQVYLLLCKLVFCFVTVVSLAAFIPVYRSSRTAMPITTKQMNITVTP